MNDYLRDPKAYAASHGPEETKRVGSESRALVRELRAMTGKNGRYCRVQLMNNAELGKLVRSRKFRSRTPLYVSSEPSICQSMADILENEKESGQSVLRMNVKAKAVDVSGLGKKRKGEALVPPGQLQLKNIKTTDDSHTSVDACDSCSRS